MISSIQRTVHINTFCGTYKLPFHTKRVIQIGFTCFNQNSLPSFLKFQNNYVLAKICSVLYSLYKTTIQKNLHKFFLVPLSILSLSASLKSGYMCGSNKPFLALIPFSSFKVKHMPIPYKIVSSILGQLQPNPRNALLGGLSRTA